MQLDDSIREELCRQGDFAVMELSLQPADTARTILEALGDAQKNLAYLSRFDVPDGYVSGSGILGNRKYDPAKYQDAIRMAGRSGFRNSIRLNLATMIMLEHKRLQEHPRTT